MARLFSRRLSSILLILLSLILLGTIIVLSTVKAYFSISSSAYILPVELGTYDEIRWAAEGGAGAGYSFADGVKSGWGFGSSSTPSSSTDANGTYGLDLNGPSPAQKIPKIIHQTWKDEHIPEKWQAARAECAAMHPDYEYKLWTDASSREFLVENYSWFVPIFDAYPFPIQRADAIRYFILLHYGGIYMDLDIGCLRRFDPLLRFEVVLPRTIPVGVSNDVMLSVKGHPFMDQLVHNLVTFNHRYLTNYPTVMFSTGPMFVSASYGLYVDAHGPFGPSTAAQPDKGFKGIRVLPKSLYGKNAKPDEAPHAFFKHFYGSSWHANDADFLIFLRVRGKLLMGIMGFVVAAGFLRMLLPRIVAKLAPSLRFDARGSYRPLGDGESGSSTSLRRSNSGPSSAAGGTLGGYVSSTSRANRCGEGRWISLPVGRELADSIPGFRQAARRATSSKTPDPRLPNYPSARRALDEYDDEDADSAGESRGASYRMDERSSAKGGGGSAAAVAASPALKVAAPRPQRLSMPFFELRDDERLDGEDESSSGSVESPPGLMAWARPRASEEDDEDGRTSSSASPSILQSLARSASAMGRRASGASHNVAHDEDLEGISTKASGKGKGKKKHHHHQNGASGGSGGRGGTLYLPAYYVKSRTDDGASPGPSHSQGSPGGSRSSTPASWTGSLAHGSNTHSLGHWAASLLPANWRAPSPFGVGLGASGAMNGGGVPVSSATDLEALGLQSVVSHGEGSRGSSDPFSLQRSGSGGRMSRGPSSSVASPPPPYDAASAAAVLGRVGGGGASHPLQQAQQTTLVVPSISISEKEDLLTPVANASSVAAHIRSLDEGEDDEATPTASNDHSRRSSVPTLEAAGQQQQGVGTGAAAAAAAPKDKED